MFLRVPGRLIDRKCGIGALAEADADAAFPVADNDDQTEVEAAAAGHYARHAARVNRHLLEFAALARRTAAAAAARIPAAKCPATAGARACLKNGRDRFDWRRFRIEPLDGKLFCRLKYGGILNFRYDLWFYWCCHI